METKKEGHLQPTYAQAPSETSENETAEYPTDTSKAQNSFGVNRYDMQNSAIDYAYIVYDTMVEDVPVQLKIDVRRSAKSGTNRFHVHSIDFDIKEDADGVAVSV